MQNTFIKPNSKTQDRAYSFKNRLFLKLKQTKMLLNTTLSLPKMFSKRAMTLINVRFTPCNMSAIVSDSVTEQKTIFGQSLADFAGGGKKSCSRPTGVSQDIAPPSLCFRWNRCGGKTGKGRHGNVQLFMKQKRACIKLQLDILSLQIKSTFCSTRRTVGEG